MYFQYERNPWGYSEGSEPTIDFCLWVLQVDGLQVPPFDQHPDGDGSLRVLGLTAPDWQSWFHRVIDREQRKSDVEQLRQLYLAAYLTATGEPDVEHLQQRILAEQLHSRQDPPLPAPPEFRYHHASWRGSAAVRDRLVELQEHYQQVSRQRNQWCDNLSRALFKEERRSKTRLYDELKPYARRVPALTIYHAVYERPLDYLVPPATLLMTVQEGQPNPQDHRERVLAAVAELAAWSGRRGRRWLYTRIGARDGQFTAAYRGQTRQPSPPPAPEQAALSLTDPARQAVVDDLRDSSWLGGSVDLTTLQFVREKQRSGWKLYEVTFQAIDGEQNWGIFILQQHEDGSWHCNGGGSSIDPPQRRLNMVIPVRDHPLLFLVENWTQAGNQGYLLTAHGQVIDNGFQVERVRLVNDAGQVLEDTVEDGYVFFACSLEQQVHLPMQAELYDHQGTIVWRQAVPDHGLLTWMQVRRQR